MSKLLGALIIDKPEGLTSHDVVARVRRIAGTRRVGHAGTLDPFATGVLVCCVGPATRLVRFLVGLDKEYIAGVRLGYATDTQDATGKQIGPLRTSKEVSLEGLQRVLKEFIGPQLQTPPMFSAKKVDGERLYRAARAGREVEREPVSIVVNSLALSENDDPVFCHNDDGTTDFSIRVRCSSGTYVRTLANDIGERLGVGAHLAKLRRTEVGHFGIDDSRSLGELEVMERDELIRLVINPAEMLSHLEMVRLDNEGIKLIRTGRAITLREGEPTGAEGWLRLCDQTGELSAVGEYDAIARVVRPRVVLEGEGL